MNLNTKWQESDPTKGVNLYIWKQHIEDISCSTPHTCQMACPGVYKPGPDDTIGKCYTYDVLSAVCLEIGQSVDVDNVEEIWEYRGGCFKNDEPALYERAIPSK